MSSATDCEDAFDNYSGKGAVFAAAFDGDTIVGSSLNVPADTNNLLSGMANLNNWLSSQNYDLADFAYPALIYVKSGYSGHGIADQLSIKKSQLCLDDGYTHTILFGYETQSIFDYSTRIGNLIDTGIDDYNGFRIYLRRLSDVISALT